MKTEGNLRVTCPDCGADLIVDSVTGHVVFHEVAKKKPDPGRDFDTLLSGLDDAKERAGAVFDREMAALEDRDRLLEEKFRAALKRAEEDPDDGPPERPWDFD